MRAQILSIGSELILGHLTDTNATYLAQQLAGMGIELTLVTQVGDDFERLVSVIRRSCEDADVVICTGGVGPTADDLTREAIAAVAGETPAVDPDLLETVRSFFRARGIEMPERNSKQAWLIPSAIALPNPVGTAPGWFVEHNGAHIAAMPGVPREMFRMWSEQVTPRLRALEPGQFVESTTVKTIGIGESAVEQVLHDLVALHYPVVATYAKDDGVHVRVTVTGTDLDQTVHLHDETTAEVIRRLPNNVYGTDDVSLPSAIGAALQRVGWTISVADSGGGGRFAAMLASDLECARQIARTTMVPSSKNHQAPELANTARPSTSKTTLGIGIHVDVEPIGNGVFEGVISIAVSGAVTAEEQSRIRSGFEDVQRRSALVAADVLLRAMRTVQ